MTDLVTSENITINRLNIEQVHSYMRIWGDNQTYEITRRISLAWAAFGKLTYIRRADIPICLKMKVFNHCVPRVITYGAETLTITKKKVKII